MPDQQHAPYPPVDDPFIEALFRVICQTLFVLPGETFVDQARRWTQALRLTAALEPRSQQEWLRAADVVIEQFAALHRLVMRVGPHRNAEQRARDVLKVITQSKAVKDAFRRYNLLRQAGAAR